MLVSAVAWAGSDEPEVEAAFLAGMSEYGKSEHRLISQNELSLKRLDEALDHFENASMDDRKRLLQACARAAEHDGRLHVNEAELLRAISEAIDCPMPPMITGEEKAAA
jgi:hypothetical protein